MIALPVIGHVSVLGAIGLACGPIALFLLLLGCCAAGSDADIQIDRAIAARFPKHELWLGEDEPFDFPPITARTRGAVNCEQVGERQWL